MCLLLLAGCNPEGYNVYVMNKASTPFVVRLIGESAYSADFVIAPSDAWYLLPFVDLPTADADGGHGRVVAMDSDCNVQSAFETIAGDYNLTIRVDGGIEFGPFAFLGRPREVPGSAKASDLCRGIALP